VRIAGDIFVDGGALESSSIDTAIQLGARRIFVLDAGYDVTPELEDELQMLLRRQSRNGRPSNAHALAVMLERTATMMGRYQLDRSIARVPPGIEVHVIRPTSTMNEAALDFDHAASWINLSYEQARASLDRELSLRHPAQQPTSADDANDASDAGDVAAANDVEHDAASGAVAQRAG
jgi:predicted acylesterase/phospholipase RssA